jgi:hypothetical protein
VFRAIGDRPPVWESRLLRLPEELARVDALLDDPAFFAPFAPHFHPVLGRPTAPAEWHLRLMFLKFRYGTGHPELRPVPNPCAACQLRGHPPQRQAGCRRRRLESLV